MLNDSPFITSSEPTHTPRFKLLKVDKDGSSYVIASIWTQIEKKVWAFTLKIASEYDQEIPQSQTADKRAFYDLDFLEPQSKCIGYINDIIHVHVDI